MSELTQEELQKNQQEISELSSLNAKTLPDSPTSSGFSAAKIKKHLYEGEFYLLNKLQGLRKTLSDIGIDNSTIKASILELENAITEIENELNSISVDLFLEDTDYIIAEEDR